MKWRFDPESKQCVLMKHSTDYIMGAEIASIGKELRIEPLILRRILVEARAAHPDDVEANVKRATDLIMRGHS